MSLNIQILSENYAHKTECAEWGFSAFIEFNGSHFLFDTGQSGDCVIKNAKDLGVCLEKIDGIILSHGHYDHTGGLKKISKKFNRLNVYAHTDITCNRYTLTNGKLIDSNPFRKQIKSLSNLSLKLIPSNGFKKIKKDFYLIGNIPETNSFEKISKSFVKKHKGALLPDSFDDEINIVIDLPEGLVILTGCAHRGIVNIMSHIKNRFNKNIYAIMGGTHLHDARAKHFNFVVDYLKKEKINYISPSHCTGMGRIFDLQKTFPSNIFPSFAGTTHTLPL